MTLLILVLSFFAHSALATVTIGNVDCPMQFEGRAKEIVKAVGPSTAYSTETVVFKNLRTLKGDVKDQVSVEILENGPIDIEPGQDYRVQTRDGRVCWIESI
jgi:hypothetical protein